MNLLSLRDLSPKFLECRSVSISDFNSITPTMPIFSPPRLYLWATAVDRKTTCFVPNRVFGVILLSHRFKGIESGKRSAEEAFNGSVSPRQRLHHQEGVTQDAPILSEHRADFAQLPRSSSLMILPPTPLLPEEVDR